MSSSGKSLAVHNDDDLAHHHPPEPKEVGEVPTAQGWTIVQNGQIDLRTVGPTERSAKVKWLYTARKYLIRDHHADTQIEELWQADSKRQGASCQRVTIAVTDG